MSLDFRKSLKIVKSMLNTLLKFAHGANLRDHRFEQYKKEKDTHVVNYTVDVENLDQAVKTHKLLQSIEQGVFLARDLTSEVATR